MDAKPGGISERLAASGIEKCLVRLSRVSAGIWRMSGIRAFWGTVEDAVAQHDFTGPSSETAAPESKSAAAVYFNVKGGFPFTSMMLFNPDDADLISKCFLGYSIPKTPGLTLSDETMLMELANIVLNSLNNSLLNALKRSAMPPAPGWLYGDRRRLAEGFGAAAGLKENFRVITAALTMQSGARSGTSEAIVLIPEELENELERMYKEER